MLQRVFEVSVFDACFYETIFICYLIIINNNNKHLAEGVLCVHHAESLDQVLNGIVFIQKYYFLSGATVLFQSLLKHINRP